MNLLTTLAQDKPVSLTWKLEAGKAFYQEMTTETKQMMKVMGSDINQTQKQTFIFSWTPEKQEADKSWVLKQKIEGVKMDIDIGGNKIAFDSTKDTAAANPLADFFKALVGSEFTITVGPDMKVTKITGRDDFIKKLTNANPQMKTLLEQILSEDSLKQMANPMFAALPGKEVKKGDAPWTSKSTLSMGPIGSYNTTYTYTPEGMSDKLFKITVASKLEYTPPSNNPVGASLPFKIKSADLKSDKAGGTILFDPEKGRIDGSDITTELKGKLSIEISNQTTDVELSQTQRTTVKTTDVNPIKK
jgi:hypothetical protein